jgi:hypothetical protein
MTPTAALVSLDLDDVVERDADFLKTGRPLLQRSGDEGVSFFSDVRLHGSRDRNYRLTEERSELRLCEVRAARLPGRLQNDK